MPQASAWRQFSFGRRVGFVAEAGGGVQFFQMEQKGAVIPALVAVVIELFEDVAQWRKEGGMARRLDGWRDQPSNPRL